MPALSCTRPIYSPSIPLQLPVLSLSLSLSYLPPSQGASLPSPSSPPFIFRRCCRGGFGREGAVGWKEGGVRVAAGSASYPICVSIMRSCPLNPALIHQPASQQARAASFSCCAPPLYPHPQPARHRRPPSLSHAHCTTPLTNGSDG